MCLRDHGNNSDSTAAMPLKLLVNVFSPMNLCCCVTFSVYMITRWRYCLNAVMITRWQYCLSRAVDNSVVRLERGRHYRSRKCCSVRITCTVAANIFFKCKFENFLMVVSTMCPHIKVAELNTLSDGKGITGIHIAICQ